MWTFFTLAHRKSIQSFPCLIVIKYIFSSSTPPSFSFVLQFLVYYIILPVKGPIVLNLFLLFKRWENCLWLQWFLNTLITIFICILLLLIGDKFVSLTPSGRVKKLRIEMPLTCLEWYKVFFVILLCVHFFKPLPPIPLLKNSYELKIWL